MSKQIDRAQGLVNRLLHVLLPGLVAVMTLAGVGATAGQAADLDPWPLGTLATVDTDPECIPGYTCEQFAISACPGVALEAEAVMAQAWPSGGVEPRGVVVLLSGGDGTSWWNAGNWIGNDTLTDLRESDKLIIVQIMWLDGWLDATPGEDAGPAHLACRPATAIEWVHDTVYLPLGLDPAEGTCGFCVTGNSGGSTQTSYALSHYGLDTIIDVAILSGGPPHAAIERGCQPGHPDGYRYERPLNTGFIDSSFGFLDGSGPCELQDPAWISRWQEESIDISGTDYSHPTTRVEFIEGTEDNSAGPEHSWDYEAKLRLDPANEVTRTMVPDMGHTLQWYQSGLDVLKASLRSGSDGAEDILAPVVAIMAGPDNPTTSTSATFTFEADEAATFACSLDGGASTTCDTGTVTYTGLSVGSHTFSVTATDMAGNVGGPVTSTWTIARLGASVSVSDDAFTKANIQVPQRRAVTWTFNGTKDQSVTESSGSGLFDSGAVAPGTTYTFVFTAAGRYNYNSSLTPSMQGSVKVPITVSATTGQVTDTFTVRWASAVAPVGFEYDVQVKRPGSSVWANWNVNQTRTSASFVPDGGTGVYSFRARMQNASNMKASGWSPLKTITIT